MGFSRPGGIPGVPNRRLFVEQKISEALAELIRRTLGDVPGKKPAYTRLTYDAIKWASAICGLLEGKV
jgi:hypothetical protein